MFLDKLQYFIHRKFLTGVKWSTKKIRGFFCLKDENPRPSSKIYEGTYFYLAKNVSKTKENFKTSWNDHKNPNKDFGSAKQLKDFPDHKCNFIVLRTTQTSIKLKIIWESRIQALKSCSLNL